MTNSSIDSAGSVSVEEFLLPASTLLAPRSRQLFTDQAKLWEAIGRQCTLEGTSPEHIRSYRNCYRRYLADTLRKQTSSFDVEVSRTTMGGVSVEVFEPRPRNRLGAAADTLLINFHGGGFIAGDGEGARIESIPVAAIAGLPVISVDYRMAPEHIYPAAVFDGVAVYSEVIRGRSTRQVGVYGSSAGALLTAQVVANLGSIGAPPPGAIGLFGLGAGPLCGDSMRIFGAIEGIRNHDGGMGPYFSGVDPSDPLAFPSEKDDILARFPPTLLLSSVRDLGLSSVVRTHAKLVAVGVDAELHIWEGLRHCFYYDPDFEESRQAYQVMARFFLRHLQ